ncbi:MAG: hypothetical protein K2X25_08225 [Caulobacteraceae bacterium]|nr:hypothetical protein [Caulobacteraceae bacterium]
MDSPSGLLGHGGADPLGLFAPIEHPGKCSADAGSPAFLDDNSVQFRHGWPLEPNVFEYIIKTVAVTLTPMLNRTDHNPPRATRSQCSTLLIG